MDITKRKKLVAVGLIVTALLCIVSAISLEGSKDSAPEEERQENKMHDITEAEPGQMTNSKSQGYNTATSETQEDTTEIKMTSSERIWNASAKLVDSLTTRLHSRTGGQPLTQEQLFGQQETTKPSPAPRAASSNPYRETAQEREERHQRRHAEAIELAERMQEGQHTTPPPQEDSPVVESTETASSTVKRSDVISSLDAWEGDNGLSSLDDDSNMLSEDTHTPFRCMFARESKITDGQRVTVILLDDIKIAGISVPRNTHLMATCQLTNRLELEFVNIEIGGRILPLGFEAYDVDGSKGIYCPDTGSAGKTVKNRGTDIISSTLSSRLGRVARDVATTGISLVQSADGQRTVNVPAGYTFFIIKKKQN